MHEDISEIPVFVDSREVMTLKATWDEDERCYYVIMLNIEKIHLDPSQVCEVKPPAILLFMISLVNFDQIPQVYFWRHLEDGLL